MSRITSTSARSSLFRSPLRSAFLEHDDERTAAPYGREHATASVPLLRAQVVVGPGMEGSTAPRLPGAMILAKRNGIIDSVDSERIIGARARRASSNDVSRESGSDILSAQSSKRVQPETLCFNQSDREDRSASVRGRSSPRRSCTISTSCAGRNVLVAFMPWRRYNFEDAIPSPKKW